MRCSRSSLGTYVYARGSITGTMTSTDGSVTVRSSGNMPGTTTAIVNVTATAKTNARITALSGDVAGTIATEVGSVTALASNTVSAAITSANRATVDAGLSVTGIVSADGAVDVYALWDITGEVNSWKGTVDANAGWAITGSIYGDKDVYTSTLIDSVSGYVYSAPAA